MIIHPKFVFAHMPKTGGTFIQQFLMKHFQFAVKTQDKHVSLSDFYDEIFDEKEHFNFYEILDTTECRSFAFIRNPFDWYISIWAEGGQWEEISGIKDFKEFIFAIFNKKEGKPHPWADFEFFNNHNFGLYTYAFIKILLNYYTIFDNINNLGFNMETIKNNYKSLCDNFYHTENLRADLIRALEKCDIDLPTYERYILLNAGRVNISDRYKDYRYYYDEELRDLIYEKDRLIFELFDYTF